MTHRIVVMGVSGAGKSTVARSLAGHLGWRFIEGDELHPAANIAKMARGEPLDDADRRPFLHAVAQALLANATPGAVAACSALKRGYRDLIREIAGPVLFVHLDVPRAELQRRLMARGNHFMPSSLLDSQLAALEPLQPDESGLLMSQTLATTELVRQVQERLGLA